VGPIMVYDEAKRLQETIIMAYATFHGLETRIVRSFNSYHPRMRLKDCNVLLAFIGQVFHRDYLTVLRDGSQI